MWFDRQHNCNFGGAENDLLLDNESLRKFPQPLSLEWRLRHGSSYLISGIMFVIGSYQYFTFSSQDYELAAITFILGGIGFLYADLSEWWLNNRVGCFLYSYYKDDYEKQVMKVYEREDTFYGKYQRSENGMNFAFSAFGSFLYFVGGVLFVPSLNQSILGNQLFIYGSAVIFLSQTWKLYRWGCNTPNDASSKNFKFLNLTYDWPGTMVDFFAGIGGFFYLIGSVYFLPDYDTSDYYTNLAATLFVCGGISFTLSGLFMQYRYYIADPPLYPH
jgi:hypothetical protein